MSEVELLVVFCILYILRNSDDLNKIGQIRDPPSRSYHLKHVHVPLSILVSYSTKNNRCLHNQLVEHINVYKGFRFCLFPFPLLCVFVCGTRGSRGAF